MTRKKIGAERRKFGTAPWNMRPAIQPRDAAHAAEVDARSSQVYRRDTTDRGERGAPAAPPKTGKRIVVTAPVPVRQEDPAVQAAIDRVIANEAARTARKGPATRAAAKVDVHAGREQIVKEKQAEAIYRATPRGVRRKPVLVHMVEKALMGPGGCDAAADVLVNGTLGEGIIIGTKDAARGAESEIGVAEATRVFKNACSCRIKKREDEWD